MSKLNQRLGAAGTALKSPAAERNKIPIEQVLVQYLKDDSQVLEIASGCGVHVAHNSQRFPTTQWFPSEIDNEGLESIKAHLNLLENPKNVHPPFFFNVNTVPRPQVIAQKCFDVILTVNLLHITDWTNVEAFFSLADLLKKDGLMVVYGPFAFDGVLKPQSNVEFDQYLKTNNNNWGIRDFRDLDAEAAKNKLMFEAKHVMPANNHILVWKKTC